MSRIAVLIPAAGASTRYGASKQLQAWQGKPLLQHAVDRANGIVPGAVFVVTGADHQTISETILDATLVHNPAWQAGLGGSIACGVGRIGSDYDGILIMLADQVALQRDDLQRLCDGFDGSNIVCARYQGQRGAPALFCRHSFSRLQRLTGGRGAKSLLYGDRYPVFEVPMERAAVDVDTPEDLRRWQLASLQATKGKAD
jgi:molybdenum cofactor cytidylyltransferase